MKKSPPAVSKKFHLEIDDVDDFITFCKVIRGGEVDEAELKKLTDTLNLSSGQLDKAVKENQ